MEAYSIRVRYTAGPARHDDAAVGIGVYPNESTMNMEIERLRVLTGPDTAWSFEPYNQDRHGCDLWTDAWRVIQATHRMQPGDLDRDPDKVLGLFRDPTGEGHGWYHIIHDGDWVDARELHTHGPDEAVTAGDGASTTVGALAAAAFWFDREHGQTEESDPLRLHMASEHALINATTLTDDAVAKLHAYEHRGMANHEEGDTSSDYLKVATMLAETDDDGGRDTATFNAHIYRGSNAGQSGVKPAPEPPKIYEEASRYTVSILPPDHPVRRHNEVTVERYGHTGDKWVVQYGAQIADRNGDLSYGDPTAQQHIFPLNEALDLARMIAPTVSVTGEHTALDVLNSPDKEWR